MSTVHLIDARPGGRRRSGRALLGPGPVALGPVVLGPVALGLAWLCLAGLCLATAGCGGGSTRPAAPPAASPPYLPDPAELRLPLDPYQLTPPQFESVMRGYRALLAQCMRRYGLTSPEPTTGQLSPRTLNERRYGVSDPALAAVAGYRLSAAGNGARPSTSISGQDDTNRLAVLTGDGQRLVNGQQVPVGGCSGEAKRTLAGGLPVPADQALAQRLSNDSFVESQREPAVTAVFAAWSSCMLARGYRYPTPQRAAADARFGGELTTAEIDTATADIACKRQTNLVGVWFDTEARLQRPKLTANRAALEPIRRYNEAQLRVARSLGFG